MLAPHNHSPFMWPAAVDSVDYMKSLQHPYIAIHCHTLLYIAIHCHTVPYSASVVKVIGYTEAVLVMGECR